MRRTRNQNVSLDISVLSLSLVLGVATLLFTVIPFLNEFYPDYSIGMIESLVTIPSLGSVFTIIFNDYFAKKFGVKKIILFGLLLVTISGVLPLFISNFSVVFALRFILGLGVGLFSPHAISLISFFYKGEKKATLLGLQLGVSALGNAVFLLLGSALISWNWHSIYWLHVLLILIFFLILKYVPKVTFEESNNEQQTTISKKANIYLLLCLWTFLIIFGVQLKVPTLFSELDEAYVALAGVTLSIMNLTGMLAGLLFGVLLKKFRQNLFIFSYILSGGSVLLLGLSTNITILMASAILFNFLYSFTGPYIVLQLNTITPDHQIVKVNSWFSIMIIASQFFAPIFWNGLGGVTQATTAQLLLYIAILLIITGAVIGFIFSRNEEE